MKFRFLIASLALLSLSGCERLTAYKDAPRELAETKAALAQLQGEFVGLRGEVVALRIQTKIDKEDAEKSQQTSPRRIGAAEMPALKSVITDCVQQVRGAAVANEFSKDFWTGFDAYYNPATDRVLDNTTMNGQLPARYAFQKCMASRGYPLT